MAAAAGAPPHTHSSFPTRPPVPVQADAVRVNDLDGMDMYELELEEIVELLGVPETAAANFHAQIHA